MVARQRSRVPAAAKADEQASILAGLVHVDDRQPGISRRASGKRFRYLGPDGAPIRDKAVIERVKRLAIPPAYRDVWICADPKGHLQATGRDARGRKQYRYHPSWRAVRDGSKFARSYAFGQSLPLIRRCVQRDLQRPGLSREKVIAVIVRLLEATLIRVGNEEYARDNKSFGLTTLRNRHVQVNGSRVHFAFNGKSGVRHRSSLDDAQLARALKRCQELPGQRLFQYLDEAGQHHAIGSADVNDYVRAATGAEFTAKDYRTWAGSLLAFCALKHCDEPLTPTQRVVQVINEISGHLGNTPAVCRKCYVHPAVIDAFLEGRLQHDAAAIRPKRGLKPEEAAFLHFLAAVARNANHRRRMTSGPT